MGYDTAARHRDACREYREWFLSEHWYLYCELCGISSALAFSTHHIYYASRYPKHPQLHNFKNLILLCTFCHSAFHQEKLNDKFLQLEKECGLKELFKKYY